MVKVVDVGHRHCNQAFHDLAELCAVEREAAPVFPSVFGRKPDVVDLPFFNSMTIGHPPLLFFIVDC